MKNIDHLIPYLASLGEGFIDRRVGRAHSKYTKLMVREYSPGSHVLSSPYLPGLFGAGIPVDGPRSRMGLDHWLRMWTHFSRT